MFADAPERTMLWIRWVLAILWILLIASCWGDTWSTVLTAPEHGFVGLAAAPANVRGEPLEPVAYTLGPRFFWSVAIPGVILFLVLFGHDAWRRVCPLSAIAQVPRRLGWQRRQTLPDGRRQVALVAAGSWWATHALHIQFFLFVVGVSLRATVLSADPLALAIALTGVLAMALIVGFFFGGKSWCHYVCPMGVVQLAISGPRGLTTAPALGNLGQSMCRTTADAPACVGCNSACPDVDIERAYWQRIPEPARRGVVYGYVGVVVGFLAYTQVLSGVGKALWWDRDLWAAGWYVHGYAIAVPRIIAAPLTLLASTTTAIILGFALERMLTRWLSVDRARHRLMTASTALALTLLVSFGVLPGLSFLPTWLVWLIGTIALAAVSMWASRTWWRESAAHEREQLAATMRRRLANLSIDLTPHLGGRHLDDLGADEIHVLAQVVPALTTEGQRRFYRDVLTDAVARGVADGPEGRRLLGNLRLRLNIDEVEHRSLLDTIVSPLDHAGRVASYRAAIEHLVLDLVAEGMPLAEALRQRAEAVEQLRTECAVSDAEAGAALAGLGADDGPLRRAGEILSGQIRQLAELTAGCVGDTPATQFLRRALTREATVIVGQMLGVVEALGDAGVILARTLAAMHPEALAAALSRPGADWGSRLAPETLAAMAEAEPEANVLPSSSIAMPRTLATLTHHADLLVALAACSGANETHHPEVVFLVQALAARATDAGRADLAAAATALIQPAARVYRVTITLPGGRVHTGTLPVSIGRATSNDVVLSSPQIGRQHVRIELRSDAPWCVDMGSTNGIAIEDHLLPRGTAMRLKETSALTLASGITVTVAVRAQTLSAADAVVSLFLHLAAAPMFTSLPQEELWNLATTAHRESTPAGSVVLVANMPVSAFRIILHGEAEARAAGRMLGVLRPGDAIGELALLTGQMASATVVARSELLVAAWPAERFATLLATRPDAANCLLMQVAGQLAATLAATLASLSFPQSGRNTQPC